MSVHVAMSACLPVSVSLHTYLSVCLSVSLSVLPSSRGKATPPLRDIATNCFAPNQLAQGNKPRRSVVLFLISRCKQYTTLPCLMKYIWLNALFKAKSAHTKRHGGTRTPPPWDRQITAHSVHFGGASHRNNGNVHALQITYKKRKCN
jgi:hypothetical protein